MRKTVRIQKKLISMKPKRYVYTVTIPEKKMKELGWDEGTELEPRLFEGMLLFKKV